MEESREELLPRVCARPAIALKEQDSVGQTEQAGYFRECTVMRP